jgi:hypothetical protein
MTNEMEFTGKAFKKRIQLDEKKESHYFQLEAMIDGELTRLQAEGDVPERCLYDKRHSLLINGALESYPPIYLVGCECGYSVQMEDVNSRFEKLEAGIRK